VIGGKSASASDRAEQGYGDCADTGHPVADLQRAAAAIVLPRTDRRLRLLTTKKPQRDRCKADDHRNPAPPAIGRLQELRGTHDHDEHDRETSHDRSVGGTVEPAKLLR
jgi:hypothetical protein